MPIVTVIFCKQTSAFVLANDCGRSAIDVPNARGAIKAFMEGGEARLNPGKEKYGF
jgi:hypothetical protein